MPGAAGFCHGQDRHLAELVRVALPAAVETQGRSAYFWVTAAANNAVAVLDFTPFLGAR